MIFQKNEKPEESQKKKPVKKRHPMRNALSLVLFLKNWNMQQKNLTEES